MRIVIDLPQDDFNSIYHGGLFAIGHDRLDQCITEAFQTARIIPIDCGDLIDRDTLKVKIPTIEDEYKNVHKLLDDAEVVVPAYRGKKNDC